MAKYLVTGGAGFIGSNIAEELVRMGEETVVFDNLSTGHERNLEHIIDDIVFIKGDIRNPDEVGKAFSGVDYVLHQAALASVPRSIEDPVLVNDVNVRGTLNVLEQARNAGVKCLVYAASSSAYGETEKLPKTEDIVPQPLSPYAVSKLVGEHYCSVYSKVYGLPTISVRYFNVFGPRQDPSSQYAAVVPVFFRDLLTNGKVTIFGDGEQTRDFIFVDDVVRANLLAAEKGGADGTVMNIATGRGTSVNTLAKEIARLAGKPLIVKRAPPRKGDIRHSFADISRARTVLGFRPETSLAKGLLAFHSAMGA
jgi:nucleoside-diphosphate-sugar epimerase